MSARGLLENPALFAGYAHTPWEAVDYFMNRVVRQPIPFKLVVHHLNQMGGTDRSQEGMGGCLFGKEERRGLMGCKDMLELLDWVEEVRGRGERGWFVRFLLFIKNLYCKGLNFI